MKNQLILKNIVLFIVILLSMQIVSAVCSSTIWLQGDEKLQKNDYLINIVQDGVNDEDYCKINIDDSEYNLEYDQKIIHEKISVKLLDAKNIYTVPPVLDIFNECKFEFFKFDDYLEYDFIENIKTNYTYDDEIFFLDNVNSDSCEFIINGNPFEISEDDYFTYNNILMKIDPHSDECEVDFYTILDSEEFHLTSDNPNAEFDNKDIEFISVNAGGFDKCFIEYDSVQNLIDVGDEEDFDDVLVIATYAHGTSDVIEEGEVEKLCEIEIKDCECDDDIECFNCYETKNVEPRPDPNLVQYEGLMGEGLVITDDGEFADQCYQKKNGNYILDNNCEGDDCYLKDYFCGTDSVISNYQECRYGCEINKCKSSPNTDELDLKNYPELFLTYSEFDGLLVIGESAPSKDTLSIVNIALGIQSEAVTSSVVCSNDPNAGCSYVYTTNPIPSSVNVFDTNAISMMDSHNIISVGNPCNNKVTQEIMDSDDCDYKLDSNKVGIIYLEEDNGIKRMVMYGKTDEDTLEISKMLQNFDDYSLSGTTYYIYGESDDDPVEECTETDDGKDYDKKGTTEGTKYGSTQTIWTDNCATNNLLVEYYCKNDKVESINYECPDDMICNSGKCFEEDTDDDEEVNNKCTESDKGIDKYNSGYVYISNSNEKQKMYDQCYIPETILPDDTLEGGKLTESCTFDELCYIKENYCSKPSWSDEYVIEFKHIICQYGCNDGACLKDEDDIEDPEVDLDKCKTNLDCNDNNETTADICSGSPKVCSHKEVDQCQNGRNCDDKNPCTTDTCAGTPKKCLNKQNSGCNLNNVCVPIGTRDKTNYCSAGNKLITQKTNSGTCNNNYECVSNVCVNSQCIEPGLIQKIIDWFTNFFG
jgi:hypothetical protein